MMVRALVAPTRCQPVMKAGETLSKEGLTGLARAAVTRTIRRGPREILWLPDAVRGGNVLYYWLHAHARQRQGKSSLVLNNLSAIEWLERFPDAQSLATTRDQVRLTDRRLVPGPLQNFGVDFTTDDLNSFIDQVLLGRTSALPALIDNYDNRYDVTLNVRRGDYYSDPRWRGEYSFDVVEYVRTAIRSVEESGPISSIHVISDDLEWCRIKLSWLKETAPVTTPTPSSDPLQQLAALAASPRLILANSTFSYWGGYLSTRRSIGRPHQRSGIWAPRFHNRYFPENGRATQLHPQWNVVEDIPGGWDG